MTLSAPFDEEPLRLRLEPPRTLGGRAIGAATGEPPAGAWVCSRDPAVPAGAWTVQVTTADGRHWETRAVASAAATTRVVLD